MDTKKIIIGAVAVGVFVTAGVWGYFVLGQSAGDKYADAIAPRDFSGQTVKPVDLPMGGFTFTVPSQSTSTDTVTTELNLVSPSATRNYPMGRFTLAGESGTLAALDNFATKSVGGRLAVPITVTLNSGVPMYYLAILESAGSSYRHVASLPIDEAIRIRSVQLTDNDVSVAYQTHARGQALAEIPTENTTAIYNIARGTVVQQGRRPRFEVVEVVKTFSGLYEWSVTTLANGDVVAPMAPGEFTLQFDGRRVRLETDCNSGTADLTTSTSTDLTIGDITATSRFCESEQEDEYFAMVSGITSYRDTDVGGYEFTLTDDSIMTFVPEDMTPSAADVTAPEVATSAEAAS